ncbi:DUF4178 domain-containing protein [Roseivirga sp.]|uniref:DUF4178 domain-containing protein n=1 Tax=Roseivirga sp. TaxID=1964215 RepID=UPI003B8D76E6
MGVFDFLKKKKEPKYDVTNLSVKDLDEGFVFDYNLKSWVVKEVYQYDWGKNIFTKEYKIDSGDEVAFLSVSDNGELDLSITKSIKMQELGDGIREEIRKKEAPAELEYEGTKYLLDEDSAGYFNDVTAKSSEWEELISYDYLNEEETLCISITQWDERNFEASAGNVIQHFEISNITPDA